MSDINELTLALEAIQKKLIGKRLSYKEIYAVMDELAKKRLGTILTTYFAASGYSKGFTNEEIYFLTKAMIETGETLHFPGIVADKHSIGGVPGTRVSMIVIPIVAAAGFTIPKSSSRAITTPGGTADDMEILCPVTFNKEQVYTIVAKIKCCIIWGGGVDIAPADDELIKVEEPLRLESYDKILVSIMAKKIAFGSNHIVIDLPYGKHVKVHNIHDAQILKHKFEYLAKKFNVKIKVLVHNMEQPAGNGIGPLLEAKDVLKVLEQTKDMPLDLQERALITASELLSLCLEDSSTTLKERIKTEFGNTKKWATYILTSGHALKKMKEIIEAQGGNPTVRNTDLKPGKYSFEASAYKKGTIKYINMKNVTIIAKILGAPLVKKSGIYLHKKIGDTTTIAEPIYTLYSEHAYNLKEAKDSLSHFQILEYE